MTVLIKHVTVSGISMVPVLHDGDTVSVCRKDGYEVGDILVFVYKSGELLVHRLLKVENDRYFCKGDNSFRLEDVDADHIIGAVILENDAHRNDSFISASLRINGIFRRCGYDIAKTRETAEYQAYSMKYLQDLAQPDRGR